MQNENAEFLTVILKYGLIVMLIMAIIFALAVLTPWMAKQVDKILASMKKKEKTAQEVVDPRCAQVKSLYDAQTDPAADTLPETQVSPEGETETDTSNTKEKV